MDTAHRLCKRCLCTFDIKQFPPIGGEGSRRRHTCRQCRSSGTRRSKSVSHRAYLQTWIARKRNKDCNIELEDLLEIWAAQAGRCAVTGMAMTYSPKVLKQATGLNASVDRIDPAQNYIKSNIRLVCHRVNSMRSSGDDSELAWWCRQVLQGTEHD